MRRILLALCGTMVLVLLALSPAYARPSYQSDLLCGPLFNPTPPPIGYTVIQPNGDLFVALSPFFTPGSTVSCVINCPGPTSTAPFASVPDCGVVKSTGAVKLITDPFPPGFRCVQPSVVVCDTVGCGGATKVCESGLQP